MDFDNLPDNCFLEILQQLPFLQKCQIGAVSRSFRRMSKIAVSKTKSLEFDGTDFGNMPDSWISSRLSKIFELCQENLEDIDLPGKFIETLAEFSFPRLDSIKLELDSDHGFDWVEIVLANHSAMKELFLDLLPNHSGQFVPTRVTFANLTRLVIHPAQFDEDEDPIVDGKFLHLLTGRCPNLQQLIFCHCQLHDEDQNAFEEFLAHCPTLEKLILGFAPGLNFFEMDSFWRLELLQELSILRVSDYVSQRGDDLLVQVANSFPRLQILQVLGLEMSNRGVGALTSLENLAVLSLVSGVTGDVECSLYRLAQNGVLRRAFLNCWISPSTFLIVVSKCLNLGTFYLGGIQNLEPPVGITSYDRWHQKRYITVRFFEQNVGSPGVVSTLVDLKNKSELGVKFVFVD